MQIVIDIDDDIYKSVVNNDAYVLGDVDWILLENAIANGTPLPKGHGRLKDVDEILKQSYRIDDSATLSTRDVINEEEIDDAPTIIEADKTESDKEKLSWLGKNCKDCGNEKCKKLGTLPQGYDCALWQAESEDKE